jgi:hypothetical protein
MSKDEMRRIVEDDVSFLFEKAPARHSASVTSYAESRVVLQSVQEARKNIRCDNNL